MNSSEWSRDLAKIDVLFNNVDDRTFGTLSHMSLEKLLVPELKVPVSSFELVGDQRLLRGRGQHPMVFKYVAFSETTLVVRLLCSDSCDIGERCEIILVGVSFVFLLTTYEWSGYLWF